MFKGFNYLGRFTSEDGRPFDLYQCNHCKLGRKCFTGEDKEILDDLGCTKCGNITKYDKAAGF